MIKVIELDGGWAVVDPRYRPARFLDETTAWLFAALWARFDAEFPED